MKNYKDKTIKDLCKIIISLAVAGRMSEDEKKAYESIIDRYSDEYEKELLDKQEEVPYASFSNCVILKNREDGEITVKTYEDDRADTMMRDISNLICFSDCDDTYEIVKIIYRGREVEYVGWMPLMTFRYRYVDTGDLAWENRYMQWNH